MTLVELITASAVIVITWYLYNVIYSIYFSPLNAIPSPLICQLVPGYMDYYIAIGIAPRILHEYHEKYGRVVRIGWRRVSFVDPSASHGIYGTYKCEKGSVYDGFKYFGVNLLTNYDRVSHSKNRRLLAPAFTRTKLNDMVSSILSKGINPLIGNLADHAQRNQPIDIFHQFHYMAWDIIGDLAFGQSFNMLQTGDHPAVGWMEGVLDFGMICYGFPFLSKLKVPSGEKLRKFSHEIMDEYYTRHVPGTSKLIASFVDATDKETGEKLSKENIFAEAHLMLFAGTDTTSNAMTFLIYQLAKHPECYKKLQAEVDSAQDINDYTKLPYVEAVIKETMRLFPPVPNMLFRNVPSSGHSLLGYYLPPGTELAVSIYSLHRYDKFWLHPTTFMPERWLDDSSKSDEEYDYMESGPQLCAPSCFTPFSQGPRSCIGKDMAMMEMTLATSNLFSKFDFELVDPDNEVSWVAMPIMRPKDSKLMVKVSNRQAKKV